MMWLRLHKEGIVEMPSEIFEKFNNWDLYEKEKKEVDKKAIEEVTDHDEEKINVEDIVGRTISNEQLKELKELLNKEENDDDFNEDEAPF